MPDQTAEIARALKDISHHLRSQNRILETISQSLTELKPSSDSPPPGPIEVPENKDPNKTYGWSMAASVQREGGLQMGDMKIEQDSSHWIWTGDIWEQVEPPSVRVD